MTSKYSLIAIFFTFISLVSFSQDRYEKEIETIGQQLNTQLTSNGVQSYLGDDIKNYKVAIVGIENEEGKSTKLTSLLEDEIAVYLAVNSEGKYNILDRNYINKLIEEKNLPKNLGNKKDFAKNLGRIKAANLMITGKLANFDNEYRLIFTIIETKEGATISGAKGKLTATELLKSKNKDIENDNSSIKNVNKNTDNDPGTLNVNAKKTEEVNNERSVEISDGLNMDPNCKANKIGTILIVNRSKYKQVFILNLSVNGQDWGDTNATIEKGDANPVLGLKEGTYTYYSHAYDENGQMIYNASSSVYSSGSISVVSCKETKIIVK